MARLPRRRLRNLERRAAALGAIRGFFADRDFLEIEAPLWVRSPGLEVHLRAVPAGEEGERGFLITSPEYQMKRLLVAGLERIFAVCRCFRSGEIGDQHTFEFTMLEWYRAWEDLEAVRRDTEALCAEVARAVRGRAEAEVGGRLIDLTPPWPAMTVAEAFARFAGVSIRGDEEPAELAAILAAAGIDTGTARAFDDLFYAAFVARVEPALAALDRPVFVTDWPVRLAALARQRQDNPAVVERFEVYVGGVELANAFGELTDPAEQRRRFESDRAERAARGLAEYPIDERLLAALGEGMPPSAGIALGVDRLVMLVAGAAHIREVVAFAPDEL